MSPYDLPDYHALVRGIRAIDRAGGDSTLARLVMADWLQDHGEEDHAELIRVDLEPDTGDDAAERGLQRRQFALTAAVSRRLFPTTPDGDGLKGRGWADGFVGKIDCSLAWWLTHGPDLCRRHPVREVAITGVGATPFQDAVYQSAMDDIAFGSHPGGVPPYPVRRFHLALIRDVNRLSSEPYGDRVNRVALRWAEAEADSMDTPAAAGGQSRALCHTGCPA